MSDLSVESRTRRTVAKMLLVVVGMFGFGFAMVPAYQVFCEITGFNGFVSLQPAANPDSAAAVDTERTVNVEFVATVNESRPWVFRPETSRLEVRPGELHTVYFVTENTTNRDTVSQIIPSVAPGNASRYLHKTECFCFTEQPFEANQSRKMPVTFFIDPAISERTTTVTLSYTLFDLRDGDAPDFDEDAAGLHSSAL